MKAVVISEPGGLERLELSDVDSPAVAAGQVRIRVAACGVCYRDLLDRQGKYPFMKRPVITGHEMAGEIVALGEGVNGWQRGDRVAVIHRAPCGACEPCRAGRETHCMGSPISYGLTVDGGYAEEALVWASSLVRVPDELPLDQAAFLHCTAGVALRGMHTHARLQAGETVLITGASGGVGVHAIQVAKILGARVVAVSTSPGKVERLRELGCDEVILAPPDGAFQREAMRRTDAGAGVDVALELVGAPTFNAALRSLRIGGRLVLIGNITAERVEVNLGYLILRELQVMGSSGATRSELQQVLGWAAEGRLKPVVADRLPLARAREAQERLANKGVVGRIVLQPR
jgi:D-arabinose 1-dehydrogenase-like Zn-dependent alcohol dehydrogenase